MRVRTCDPFSKPEVHSCKHLHCKRNTNYSVSYPSPKGELAARKLAEMGRQNYMDNTKKRMALANRALDRAVNPHLLTLPSSISFGNKHSTAHAPDEKKKEASSLTPPPSHLVMNILPLPAGPVVSSNISPNNPPASPEPDLMLKSFILISSDTTATQTQPPVQDNPKSLIRRFLNLFY